MSENKLQPEGMSESTLRPEDLEVGSVFPAAPDFRIIDQDPISGGDPVGGRIIPIGNHWY